MLYWTFDKCKSEASNYTTLKEFRINSNSAYQSTLRHGWLHIITSHMMLLQKPSGYWTKNKCYEEALKYESRAYFQKGSKGAYLKAHRNSWLDDICSHMVEKKHINNYWKSKVRCHEEALLYNTKSDFQKYSSSAYNASKKYGWYDDVCSHMVAVGNRKSRIIYVFEFPDKTAYIGLTYNPTVRKTEHFNSSSNSSVLEHCNITGLSPIFKILIPNYVVAEEAQRLESYYMEEYKQNGWSILNKVKCGALGGSYKIWSEEKCKEEALKYTSKKEFIKKSGGAYNASLRGGWINNVCGHMVNHVHPANYWTKERCHEEALKYNTKNKYIHYSNSSYVIAAKNKWLADICEHMVKSNRNA